MLTSTPEGFADDVGGFFGPHKGGRVRIPLGEVPLDVADEGADRIERASADRLARQNAEPCFDQIQPGGPLRGEMKVDARMLPQPRLHRGRLVCGGVVENHVQLLPAIAAGQPLEEGQEIDGRMLRAALAQDFATRHLEGGVQAGQAIALVVVRLARRQPGRNGSRGCVRLSAWICVFSSTLTTTAFVGGCRYRPTTSWILASASGSVVNLKVVTRWGCSAWPCQIRCTVLCDTPAVRAISRVVQCVTPRPGGRSVRATICARWRALTVGGRPDFGRSCNPATPSSA